MIPFDLVYYKPESVDEALEAYQSASEEGLAPRYLSGGTELVTLARDNKLQSRAFIDLKTITECRGIAEEHEQVSFGSCVTLNEVIQRDLWSLLSDACRGVGDHTVRNTVTIGGNAAGMLPYREALLPFLIAGGDVEVGGPQGRRPAAVREVFDKRLKLAEGEFLVRLTLPRAAFEKPSYYVRHTKDARVDYPLVSLTMLRDGDRVRAAVAGTASYPVARDDVDELLSRSGDPEERAAEAAGLLDGSILTDMRGSADYRRFLFEDALAKGLRELEG
jgi:CO/xanthine dehydrogenase FAD-binding subunit